jgi:hypothetical protein
MQRCLVIAVGTLLLLSFGCGDRDRVGRLEKQVQELQNDTKKQQVSTLYDLQSRCSRDAKVWFNDNWNRDKETKLLDYTNHYNSAQNKCFILVEYHYSLADGSSWVMDMSLTDVYENDRYGNVSVTHTIHFKPVVETQEVVGSCVVVGTKCKDVDEFNRLVRPYMTN